MIWKKITPKSKLEGKVVILKVGSEHAASGYWDAYWDDETNAWGFIDQHCVKAKDWIGEPTHYQLVNE